MNRQLDCNFADVHKLTEILQKLSADGKYSGSH